MNTCKDCLCYNACQFHIDEETSMTVNECSHGFKHKDQYVKLPAYVGQKVWLVQTYWGNKVEVHEGKVSMLQQKADKSWKFRVSHTGSVYDCTLDEIGNTIFLDKDSANIKADELKRATKNEER